MKGSLLIAFICIRSVLVAHPFLDSLLRVYPNLKQDTEKVKCLYEIGRYYSLIRVDSTLYYARKTIDYAEKLNYDYGIYLGYIDMFWAMNTSADYNKALKILLKNLERAQNLKTHRLAGIARVTDYLGLVHMEMQLFQEAMAYSRSAMVQYANCGEITQGQWSAYSVIATIYLQTKKPDSALWYAQKAYEISQRKNVLDRSTSLPTAILANAWQANGRMDEAEKFYRMGIAIENIQGNDYLKARLYYNLAGLFRQTNRLDSAIHYANASLELCQRYDYVNYALNARLVLAELYESSRKSDSALKYIKSWLVSNASLFSQQKLQEFNSILQNERQRQQEIEAARLNYQNRLRNYSFLAIIAVILLVALVLWRNNIQRRKTNIVLQDQKKELEMTLTELKSTQNQLIQSEKMASLGELTAGIAHEIQNPLNFVNNFSEVNIELMGEMKEEMKAGHSGEALHLASDIEQNLVKVVHHGKRADSIVKGMLQHSRTSSGQKEPTDLNALAEEYLHLSYHGMRARDKQFNATIRTSLDPAVGQISIVPQDIGRALLNLFNNALYYANQEKNKRSGSEGPVVSLSTKRIGERVEIRIRDNGPGIPQKIMDKIFQPFFTTKTTGEGTGLGLSLAYDIVTKEHGGQLRVETREAEFTEFIILL